MNWKHSWEQLVVWLKWYYLGIVPDSGQDALLTQEDAAHVEPAMTGDQLINDIVNIIRLRRSALVTGPRGCGKSYCSDQAIRQARDKHKCIGGWRFLQGNREIPRDVLSEDLLVIGDTGKPELLKAIPLRELDTRGWDAARQAQYQQHRARQKAQYPDWPAIPTMRMSRADALKLWTNDDWTVLYLDEINRFGDGFLDSLLSLTEEGKLVRRGEDYWVPMLVVATANPPGYDATAKKLSPPLQARIARSFRVAQPGFEDLVHVIIAPRAEALKAEYGVEIPEDLRRLAAAATLCLWGDPGSQSQGMFFLTAATRRRFKEVMNHSQKLRRAMRTLSSLITFGPDARAVQDWLASAVAVAASNQETTLTEHHLRSTAVGVLGHKVREIFNEGAEPGKTALKELCVAEIVEQVFTDPEIRDEFVPPLASALRTLGLPEDALTHWNESWPKLPEDRRSIWLRALSRIPGEGQPLDPWLARSVQLGALASGPVFFWETERAAILELTKDIRPELHAQLQKLPTDSSRQLSLILADSSTLRVFSPELLDTFQSNNRLLSLEIDRAAWVMILRQLLEPAQLEVHLLDRALWNYLMRFLRPEVISAERVPRTVLELLRDSLVTIERVANSVGQARCARSLARLQCLQTLPLEEVASLVFPRNTLEHASLMADLLRIASRLFEVAHAESLDQFARLAAWFKLLERNQSNPGLIPGEARTCQAMSTNGFYSPTEQILAVELINRLEELCLDGHQKSLFNQLKLELLTMHQQGQAQQEMDW